MKILLLLIAFTVLFQIPANARHSKRIIRNISLVDRIQKKNRQHKCKLYQQGCHVRGDATFNWGRRPTGHWPFQFLQ